MNRINAIALWVIAVLGAAVLFSGMWESPRESHSMRGERTEVVFWHFWGGEDRAVVRDVVDRFNASQNRYWVRDVAVPGNNLDVKLFLSVTGGDPPDLVNQDDPIVADWARRGALTPLDELASPEEIQQLDDWLFPSARHLGQYDGRYYALCNGLDVRALYYNATLLKQYELAPPRTLEELDHIAHETTLVDDRGHVERFGFLPDARRLLAWGAVFGGRFYDEREGRITADDPANVRALEWMTSYRNRYGADQVAGFSLGDQSLPGKTFPLLSGRYVVVMDGQWRVRDIAASQQRQRDAGEPVTDYGACPLPPPADGQSDAGWINGNFFVVPRGAKNPEGAWAFMKFWSGFGGNEAEAARTCAAGGWIPVSSAVVAEPDFQAHLDRQPLMRTFVDLAASPRQIPIPVIPGASYYDRQLRDAGQRAMYDANAPPPRVLLEQVTERVQAHLDRTLESPDAR